MKTKLAAIAMGMLACLALAPAARADAPDTSTPKKTGLAFARAVESGDMATAKLVATGTEAQWKVVQTLSDYIVALKAFTDASTAKFGPDGKVPAGMAIKLSDDFETADEKIEGDTATLIFKRNPDDKYPPTFKKTASGWVIDLVNLEQDPSTKEMTPMLVTLTKAFNSIAAEIKAGKYKSMEEVGTAMQAAMSAAPAPAPAAQ